MENTSNQIGLGGRPREKDKRDYSPQLMGMGAPYPQEYASPTPTIYMQGTYGTCGSHAGASLINDLYPGKVTSPKYLWKKIKQIDGWGLNDGTDMRSIFRALQQSGVCELSLMDDTLEESIEKYSDPGEITPNMDANAAQFKIGSYGFIDNPTMPQIMQAIFTYKAVILLVDCGDGWWLPSWGPQNNPLHVGNLVGHHFICANAYGMTAYPTGQVKGPNSWSTLWGDGGMFRFLSDFLPHVVELGFATPATQPPKFVFKNNLSYLMMNNPDVHALQVRLGMDPQYQTGNFLGKTLAAVWKFQAANGLPVTGFVGPMTRAVLNK